LDPITVKGASKIDSVYNKQRHTFHQLALKWLIYRESDTYYC